MCVYILLMQAPAQTTHSAMDAFHCLSENELLRLFLSGKSKHTLKAYSQDLQDFIAFSSRSSNEVIQKFFKSQSYAYKTAIEYRSHLIERKLAPATINRRLASLRSFTKLARKIGLVQWSLEIESIKTHRYKDTQGPGHHVANDLIRAAGCSTPPKSARDSAILILLFTCALRRSELVSLNVEDIANDSIWIQSKGYQERERLTLPKVARDAIASWISTRGNHPGPLFISLDKHTRGSRLTGNGVYKIIRTIGQKAGIGAVRPHGIRHAAITCALDMEFDIRKVQRFSRHRDIRTVLKYDDNRTDFGGQIAEMIASTITSGSNDIHQD